MIVLHYVLHFYYTIGTFLCCIFLSGVLDVSLYLDKRRAGARRHKDGTFFDSKMKFKGFFDGGKRQKKAASR